MKWDKYAEIAKKAVLDAGEILKGYFRKSLKLEFKDKFDIVTDADLRSEEVIKKILKKEFPDIDFIAEEGGGGGGEIFWVIDPLDGTKNFFKGFPWFGISVALVENMEVRVGVIYNPLNGEMFWGVDGGGAFLNKDRIKVSSNTLKEKAMIATGFPHRAREKIDNYLKVFKEIFLSVSCVRRAGSATLDLAYTALGIFDAFFEYGLSIWDIAAGSLLVKEAGGIVTDFKGEKNYLKTGNIIAGNVFFHKFVLEKVNKLFFN